MGNSGDPRKGRGYASGPTWTSARNSISSLAYDSTRETLYGVWGSGPKDVFAVGSNGTILHYDGRAWKPLTSGTA